MLSVMLSMDSKYGEIVKSYDRKIIRQITAQTLQNRPRCTNRLSGLGLGPVAHFNVLHQQAAF